MLENHEVGRKRKNARRGVKCINIYKRNGDSTGAQTRDKLQREQKNKVRSSKRKTPGTAFDDHRHKMTLSTLLKLWQESNGIRLKGGTRIKYENLIRAQIDPELGKLRLSEITPLVINRFLEDKLLNGRVDGLGGLSVSYVRSISLVISSALSYGVSEGLMPPFKAKINKPSIVKRDLPILSYENQKVLEQHIKAVLTPTNIGILISLYTGLRIGEVCALCWDDIDFDNKTIFVRHTISRVKANTDDVKTKLILDEPKTASSKRVIPIPSTLYSILLDCRKTASSTYVVSNTENYVSPRTYDYRFHKVIKDCNIEEFNYHGLRHTFATRCVEAGVDIKTLSEILGHSNVSITLNTYVHSTIEMKRNQLEKIVLLPL